jgi:hypothetical protein
MFRDRLRQWGMNDKNHRGTINQKRKVVHMANNRDKLTAQPYLRHPIASCDPIKLITFVHESPSRGLPAPKETRMVQRALKSVLDWQNDFEVSRTTGGVCPSASPIARLLLNIKNALGLNHEMPSACTRVTQELNRCGAALESQLKTACSPTDVFRSAHTLLYFAQQRTDSAWYRSTSEFLFRTIAEALPGSHPSRLLFHILLGEPTPAQLVTIYEVGCSFMHRCHGEVVAMRFRAKFLATMRFIWPRAAFESYADSYCDNVSHIDDTWCLHDIADLQYRMRRYKESAELAKRCLALLEDRGNENSLRSADVWRILVCIQQTQGEETSLNQILKISLILNTRPTSNSYSPLDLHLKRATFDLEDFYRRHGLDAQRNALRQEFVSAFEL